MGACERACAMSQFSQVTHSRHQWKGKAKQRGDDNRYLRKQLARVKAERDKAKRALQETQVRLRQLESQVQAVAGRPKVDGVWIALRLFLEVRISFRAVCRVMTLPANDLGIQRVPCPQTVINWVIRLSLVRIESARALRGLPLSQAPFSNGLIWIIDISIGLGSGKILAVLALDAHHHQLVLGAPSLAHAPCIAVSVADSWTGDTIAELLSGSSPPWAGRPPTSKTPAAICIKPPMGWPNKAWPAHASTISHTLPRACSNAITSTTRPSSVLCRPVVGSRASSSTPSWRAWRRPPCAPRPALCMCTAWSPGPSCCSSSRPLAAPRLARS